MSKLTPAQKNEIAASQYYKCANKPGSNLLRLENYACHLWKKKGAYQGSFDNNSYEIDHIIETCLTNDNSENNLQALCPPCHKHKTINFLKNKKQIVNNSTKKINNLIKKREIKLNIDKEKIKQLKLKLKKKDFSKSDSSENDDSENDDSENDNSTNDNSTNDESENDESENDESENDESENDESENDKSENDESKNNESENDDSENDDSKNNNSKKYNASTAHSRKTTNKNKCRLVYGRFLFYTCDRCSRIFDRKTTYDQHKNRKTDCLYDRKQQKQIIFHECKKCGKIFSRKDVRDNHMKKCKIRKTTANRSKNNYSENSRINIKDRVGNEIQILFQKK